MYLRSLLTIVCGGASLVQADLAFQYPSLAGADVVADKPVVIRWTTDWDATDPISLIVYQDLRHDGAWAQNILLNSVLDPKNYTWVPSRLSIQGSPYYFHFNLINNVSQSNVNSGNMSLVDAASLGTTTTTTTVVTATSTNTPPPASTSSTVSHGLSGHTKTGLGVGLGLGMPILLLAAGFLLALYRRKLRRGDADDSQQPHEPYEETLVDTQGDQGVLPFAAELPAEIPNDSSLEHIRISQRHEVQ